jgi:hypothetical protein
MTKEGNGNNNIRSLEDHLKEEDGGNLVQNWEVMRLRRLRNAEKARIEAEKGEVYRKLMGRERPSTEPEGTLVIIDFRNRKRIGGIDRNGNPLR